ncbi:MULTISPECIES: tRNA threonylcarbamoyladenosine dehydratase [Tepidiphilus]|uniref:tRNA threonylcarbamoyladenosine dehydratase n=1 Tax=Tepidiphilus TaxID=203470 RepID=UPI00115CBF6B|nr:MULTISPECIES: tRNA threonylcarbamoyladenosine dehydratase [Tepidiphilus]
MSEAVELERRFGGIERLYGKGALARLQQSKVAVVGVGGVGSWAAEALVRSGVGGVRLIDLDVVAESNCNRQIHALSSTLGRAKVEAMAERLADINPSLSCELIDDFLTPENCAALAAGMDAVIDAVDAVRAKAALAAHCRAQGIFLVMTGAAGGKRDPARLEVADLAHTVQDPLLAKTRASLRREYGFPRGRGRFGIPAVFSPEPMRRDAQCDARAGLACAGYGSSMMMTATMGLIAAERVVAWLVQEER